MVWPRIVPHSAVDSLIGVAGTLGAEFPNGPVLAVLQVQEADELVQRIPICQLGIRLRRTRSARQSLSVKMSE